MLIMEALKTLTLKNVELHIAQQTSLCVILM